MKPYSEYPKSPDEFPEQLLFEEISPIQNNSIIKDIVYLNNKYKTLPNEELSDLARWDSGRPVTFKNIQKIVNTLSASKDSFSDNSDKELVNDLLYYINLHLENENPYYEKTANYHVSSIDELVD